MGKLLRLIGQRLGLGLLTLPVVSVLIFFAVELLPGDLAEAVLCQAATEETVAAMRAQLGLDLPAPLRYMEWLAGAAVGDLGNSLVTGDRVSEAIGERLLNTLMLAIPFTDNPSSNETEQFARFAKFGYRIESIRGWM